MRSSKTIEDTDSIIKMRNRFLSVVLFLLVGVLCRDALGAEWRPLAIDEIEMFLVNSVTGWRVSSLVREHGVDFRISEEVENKLRALGLDDSAIGVLRESFKEGGLGGGIIRVYSDPDGADVFVQDELKGTTPLRLAGIPPGRVVIRVGGVDGYRDETREEEVREGEVKDVRIDLKRGKGPGRAQEPPSSGAAEGPPFVEKPVPGGEKSENVPARKWRRVPSMKGVLHIETEPAGARIFERGQFKGRAPMEMQLGEGLHVLVFIMENFEIEAIPVVIRKEINPPLSIKFIPR